MSSDPRPNPSGPLQLNGDRRAFRLSLAGENAVVRIVAIHDTPGLARRVAAMGFDVGCALTVIHRGHPGLVVARGAARFALGGDMAHRILVCAT